MQTTLKALAALLTYPGPELRAALPDIATALREEGRLRPAAVKPVLELADRLARGDPLESEEAYVATFDRGRATSLNLFEHLHGESRDRGGAMVDLKLTYERAGYRLAARQLPDYLPVVLEFASTRPRAEAVALLADCAHIVRAIGEALALRGSPYAAVPAAVLALAGEPGLAERPRPPAPEKSLDEEWMESEVVFGPGAAAECRGAAGDASVVRFSPRNPPRNEGTRP